MAKNNALQHLKAIMLLGVVVNHAWAAHQYITTPQIPPMSVVSWFSNFLIISGLPTFFFLSGFFAGKHLDEVLTWDGYRKFLVGKVRSLAVPYLCWNLFFILFYLSMGFVFPRLAERVAQKQLGTAAGFFISLLGWGTRPIDAPLWFIRDLFLIFCCVPIMAWIIKRAAWMWVLLFGVLMGFPSVRQLTGGWQWYSVFCVAAGMFVSKSGFDLRRLEWWRFVLPVIWVLFSIIHFVFWQASGTYYPNIYMGMAFNLISVVAWLSMAKWFDFDAKSFFARCITPASFFIYCSHFLVCSCCLHLVAGRVPDSPYKLLILYSVFIGIGIPLILCCYHLGKRIAPKVMSVLAGGRVT